MALVVGGICLFISILLLLNYWNIQKTDPLESEAMASLVERLKEEPNNDALKLEIHQLDLLARKAYFTSHWQVRTGGFLLLFSSITLVLLLKILYDMKKKIELPEAEPEKGMLDRILSQRWIGLVGILVISGALLASFTSKDYLAKYELAGSDADMETAVDEGIEVIEISSSESSTPPQDTEKEIAETDTSISNQDKDVVVEKEQADKDQADKVPAFKLRFWESVLRIQITCNEKA